MCHKSFTPLPHHDQLRTQDLGVGVLSLPAATAAIPTWVNAFHFQPVEMNILQAIQSELRLLMFPGSKVLYRALGENQPPGGPFSFAALISNQTGAAEGDAEEDGDDFWMESWGPRPGDPSVEESDPAVLPLGEQGFAPQGDESVTPLGERKVDAAAAEGEIGNEPVAKVEIQVEGLDSGDMVQADGRGRGLEPAGPDPHEASVRVENNGHDAMTGDESKTEGDVLKAKSQENAETLLTNGNAVAHGLDGMDKDVEGSRGLVDHV